MAKVAFTDSYVKNIAPSDRRQEIADAHTSGLYLFVQPSGAKSFVHRYRHAGRIEKVNLGQYPALTLAAARQRVMAGAVAMASRGVSPHAEKVAAKRAEGETFRAVVTAYLDQYAVKKRNGKEMARHLGMRKTAEGWQEIPGKPVAIWGSRRIEQLTFEQISDYLAKEAKRAPIGANRTHTVLTVLPEPVNRPRFDGA